MRSKGLGPSGEFDELVALGLIVPVQGPEAGPGGHRPQSFPLRTPAVSASSASGPPSSPIAQALASDPTLEAPRNLTRSYCCRGPSFSAFARKHPACDLGGGADVARRSQCEQTLLNLGGKPQSRDEITHRGSIDLLAAG